ncbi:cysteine desulfurase family protein [Lyngbya confervoides]|uniref:cysteine desulfurase n=1 Tax=Lyngbya confervoides BDU141951 TaxID=1574623 RepID=A0ABD4T485_9CYAN|nr:aminotransferase class V-fold PLP-dependent enzyme [Lyngbya confervoides]MCM1983332.1 aminotransferase class V-fold PLP-dependent enzyme [Lyngbya confervoides BDU141951]
MSRSADRPWPIYLDGMATTPVDERVIAAMLPYLHTYPGNPASLSHAQGWQAAAAVKQARRTIAKALHAQPEEIIFTSGATESNNLAIKGVAERYLAKGRHLVTVQTEHSAVLAPCRYLETLGFEVTYLGVDSQGLLDMGELERSLRPDTVLVSVMAANNEIGVLQPLAEIGAICRERGILFHTDAAQAIAKVPLDVVAQKIDLLSITGHKLYGPKGIGALYLRRSVRLAPQLHGGEQERGVRSGTLATHQIMGLATAIDLGLAEQAREQARLIQLRNALWQDLQTLGGVYRNGHPTRCLPGCLSVSFAGVDGSALILAVQKAIAVSSGSACSSGKSAPSPVLRALGRPARLAQATLRFGMGRFTTAEEIAEAGQGVREAVTSLRAAVRP